MILFWDRNIGKAIPQALLKVQPRGVEIRYYAEVFPGTDSRKEISDDWWLGPVGDLGWVVITQDHEYHHKPAESEAIKQHNVACFYLWGRRAPKWETFQCFAKAYDRIVDAADGSPRPFIYDVNKRGSLRKII